MKKSLLMSLFCAGLLCISAQTAFSQEMTDLEVDKAANAVVEPINNATENQPKKSNVFKQVILGEPFNPIGFLLWIAIFATGGILVFLAIDCAILIRTDKIMPQGLIVEIEEAMREGDVVKALQYCENDPTPLAHILSAGFSHVEEGFEVIDEAIASAAEVETEKIMQRLTWISVVGNLAPMMGLLGTVQGMIEAFKNLSSGTPDVSLLAGNISLALWTTAAGLIIAIPAVAVYYSFRNRANNIVLKMTIMTSELIKDLRNIEVVSE